MQHIVLVTIFGLLLVPGLIMAFVPLLPAFWFLFAVVIGFALIDGFVHLTPENLAALAVVFLLSIIVDWISGLLGAKLGGATWKSLLYGVVGGALGILVFPPFGIFLGLFVGVLIGELVRHKSRAEALYVATGALAGSLSGVAINVLLALAFVVLFVVFAAS